jgi:small-conductance mechanosensitive channel
LTVALCAAVLVVAALIRGATRLIVGGDPEDRSRFWIAQATHLLALAGIVTVVVKVWLESSGELAVVGGYVAAGLAIALQRVITSFAAYLIILRGNAFSIGDRIVIGGVRGDVVALGFMQTTVMEMGQAPGETQDNPSTWVRARQYSGRIVRVTNDKIFDTPIYNYTRDFPFMWEEMMIPVRYADDYQVVERIMLDTARRHTSRWIAESGKQLETVREKYFLSEKPSVEPSVYVTLTDNWIQLSLRFVVGAVGARQVKDAMSREILAAMNEAKIAVASGTYAIVELPTIRVQRVS